MSNIEKNIQVQQALSDILQCLEANSDHEVFVPFIIQGYIALAKANNTSSEAILQERCGNSQFPSIAQLHHEEIIPEWEWASQFVRQIKQVKLENPDQATAIRINISDVSELEVGEEGFIIEVQEKHNMVTCVYKIPGVERDTAERIAQIISLCFQSNDISVEKEMECSECFNQWTGLPDSECPECGLQAQVADEHTGNAL
ncbi:hypothetical protein IQ268_16980 [Oculatella sp. LEGE 06141]|uniref:hypothetical protein n=1 Tax=Oculatella sp. LEGE 06141 TaxID=1828648 RepID=UPI001882182F|nr:hypothetical protein [Oculatella sp. LEGE 06141]MBE9180259.1 hypothetical protein [Oculatella sp. LEGE 06141]